MLTFLLSLLNDFSVGLLLADLVFMIPLKKKDDFFIRGAVALVLYLVLGASVSYLFMTNVINSEYMLFHSFLMILGMLGLICLFTVSCCRITWQDGLWVTLCAYTTQNFIYSFGIVVGINNNNNIIYPQYFILLTVVTLTLVYLCVARQMVTDGAYDVTIVDDLAILLLVLGVSMVMSSMVPQEGDYYKLTRLYGAVCCILILVVNVITRKSHNSRSMLERQTFLWEQQKQQLEFSRGNIELINHRFHELKHYIQKLKETDNIEVWKKGLEEIEYIVTLYNSTPQTENPVLDTILTEASLICEREKINWTCFADGSNIGIADAVDLYGIIHGVITTAINISKKIGDKEKRVLTVSVFTKGEMVILQSENFYEVLPDNLLTELKNVEFTLDKYGGTLSVDIDNNILMITMLIPQKQRQIM